MSVRVISAAGEPPQSERDYSSDTMPGNRARVSKPIEIIDRGILVGHRLKRKHPSCARLAARYDAENLERPLARSLPWRGSIYLSPAVCQLLYTVPGITRWNRAFREAAAPPLRGANDQDRIA